MPIAIRQLHLTVPADTRTELLRLGLPPHDVEQLVDACDGPVLRLAGVSPDLVAALCAADLPLRLVTAPSASDALLVGSRADLRALSRSADPSLAPIAAALSTHLDRLAASRRAVTCAGKILRLDERVHLMGILNVTPDSFSDGGRYFTPDDALRQADAMLAEGADIIDVGGESSRPAGPYGEGAKAVSADEEIRRTAPVIEAVAKRFDCVISIDTVKCPVAKAAVDGGATLINDITALRGDAEMARFVAESGLPVVLMHMQGTPADMQRAPRYVDLMREIHAFFTDRIAAARSAGIREDRILLDPGIGFGKKTAHNYEILRRLPEFAGLGHPLVLGTSRKGFLVAGLDLPPAGRLEGTLASHVFAVLGGARILRVHDVGAAARALHVVGGVMELPPGAGEDYDT